MQTSKNASSFSTRIFWILTIIFFLASMIGSVAGLYVLLNFRNIQVFQNRDVILSGAWLITTMGVFSKKRWAFYLAIFISCVELLTIGTFTLHLGLSVSRSIGFLIYAVFLGLLWKNKKMFVIHHSV